MGAGLQPGPASEPPTEEAAVAVEEPVAYADKVVVRRSRKGRGGRTVTEVAGVVSGRDAVLSKLKRELGCGARVEGDGLVIQGDHVERVARWFESQGAARVVRG